jgi:EAL domain-containing protein (putative c-di-GMP-specific phosphodiesterase class I)
MASGRSAPVDVYAQYRALNAVIAEGVEDQGTFDRLADLGCDIAQGYCISRPILADQFLAWEAEPARH